MNSINLDGNLFSEETVEYLTNRFGTKLEALDDNEEEDEDIEYDEEEYSKIIRNIKF